jgi:hypothetical protein
MYVYIPRSIAHSPQLLSLKTPPMCACVCILIYVYVCVSCSMVMYIHTYVNIYIYIHICIPIIIDPEWAWFFERTFPANSVTIKQYFYRTWIWWWCLLHIEYNKAVGYKIYLLTNTDQPERHKCKMKSIRNIYSWLGKI